MIDQFNYLAKQLDHNIMMVQYNSKALAENVKIFGHKHSMTEMSRGWLKQYTNNLNALKKIMIDLGYWKAYVSLRRSKPNAT